MASLRLYIILHPGVLGVLATALLWLGLRSMMGVGQESTICVAGLSQERGHGLAVVDVTGGHPDGDRKLVVSQGICTL